MTNETISEPKRPEQRPLQSTPEQRDKARLARQAIKANWPPVKQPRSDDWDYLKGILSKHGISRIPEAEPATVKRLAKLIRRAGLTVSQAEEGVGLKLPVLIEKNPGHPLWWLLATTLEASA